MNIEKELILIKGEDKTKDIIYCKKINGKYNVTFKNNKTYPYRTNDVHWIHDSKELDVKSTIIYEKNSPILGIAKIIDFDDYIRIIFKNNHNKLYPKRSIYIEKSCLDKIQIGKSLEYLKELASLITINKGNEKDSKGDSESFLQRQYNKIDIMSPRCVLAKYLEVGELRESKEVTDFIFPFGFNISQKEATEKAINNKISIIEGPPGTGKTQTILNIIANAIVNNKTVAVVSNNNSATANVIEKLEKYDVDFMAAYLGNSENKGKFIQNQSGFYPEMKDWKLESEDEAEIRLEMDEAQYKLNQMLKYKNKGAKTKQELDKFLVEHKYYNEFYEKKSQIESYSTFYTIDSDNILSLWLNYESIIENKQKLTLGDKFKYLLKYGIYNFKFYNNSSEDIIALFQSLYYKKKIEELTEEIHSLERKLENYNFDDEMNMFSQNSMKLLKSILYRKRGISDTRQKFSDVDLWKDFNGFVSEYPIILSTTHSLRNCAGQNFLFDYVIVDEASQVDIVSGGLALSCGENLIVVGDEKQLPNVVGEDIAKVTNEVFERFNMSSQYRYASNSLLSSIKGLYPDITCTLLREHYRCNPKIIGFCNQKFYNDELIILTEGTEENPLVVYKTVEGNHARGTLNQREIDVVFEEIIPGEKLENTKKSVGIISPYKYQKNEINKRITNSNIETDTVHKFQGREKDVIIITTVANEINDFIDDPHLINVAVSRAVDKLILVVSGNDKFLNKSSNIGDLIKYISYNNFEIKESKINSVFDLLYKGYNEKRRELLKHTNKSKYDSENLMSLLIDEVLKENEYSSITYAMHEPLKLLIKDMTLLNDREKRFTHNINTHTDFVLFNKLDKKPVLVIEVDGYGYHENNEKQSERDDVKDSILEKYNIPIIRFKTNCSGEDLRLRCKLNEILKIQG